MVRRSKKQLIIEAAFEIIDRDGVRGLTYDSLAAATGITKGGILYHFASRDDLLRELHSYLAHKWQMELEENSNHRPPSELSRAERLRAYVKSSTNTISRAQLLLLVESGDVEKWNPMWAQLEHEWMPVPPAGGALSQANPSDNITPNNGTSTPMASPDEPAPREDEILDDFIIRLAADGLWLYDSMNAAPLDEKTKNAVIRRLLELRAMADEARNTSRASR
ncbi:TetR family transcriptional regulator [Arcanobacterium haemolyticum]|nr:TetR family transcriptional regulator [Arcanobacterium haemolyticum]